MAFAHYPDGSRQTMSMPSNVSNPLTINSGQYGYKYDGVGRLVQVIVPHPGDYLQQRYTMNGWLDYSDSLRVKDSYATHDAQHPAFMEPSFVTFYTYYPRGFLYQLTQYPRLPADPRTGNQERYVPQADLTSTYDVMGNRLIEGQDYGSAYFLGVGKAYALNDYMYTYDTAHAQASQNRDVLIGEKKYNSPPHTNNFSYDAAYNPTGFSLYGTPTAYPSNADNQIINPGFAYDGSGNPALYQSATLSFDPEDRLTAISTPAFAASYDGDGLRATKTANGNTTYFLYDGSQPVLEENFDGVAASLSAVNTFGPTGWCARYYPGGEYYNFVFKSAGSMLEKQNSSNTTSTAYSIGAYEAYGNNIGETSTATGASPPPQQDPVGFGGQYGYYTDRETGLVLMGHRYYDPGTGRFLTRDPMGYGGGMNLYGYADGNPVNESDPDGFDPSRKRTTAGSILATAFSFKAIFGGPIYRPAYTDHHGVVHPRVQIPTGEMPGPGEAASVAASASKAIVPSVMHTLDLSSSAWRRTKFAQEGLVYVLKDVSSGEALKAGQTTAGKFVGRFEKYVTAANRNNRKLILEVFETPLAERGEIEGVLRRTFGRAPKLPWDNAGRPPRLGRPGRGVP